jgi:Glycosyltransferase family 87
MFKHQTINLALNALVAIAAAYVIAGEVQRALPGEELWDFGSFVASGRAAREGLNPYGIYPLTLHVSFPGFEAWNPNLNPPISALLFQLFDFAEPHRSFQVWWAISVLCYGATVLLLLRRYGRPDWWVLLPWAFALAGFWDTLVLGQIYLPLVLAGAGAWLLLERGEGRWAGFLIGLVVAMKPNFLVWPVLLFLSGHRTPALVGVAVAAAISAVPLVVIGPEVYRQWFELIASDSERAFFLTNASLVGLAARMGVPSLGLGIGLALLGVLALWALRARPGPLQASAWGLLLSLLASPIAWIHYTLFLLPVLFSRWRMSGIRLVAVLLIVPVPFIIDRFGQPAWVQVTSGSIYNWALVLCLAALLVHGRMGLERTPEANGGVQPAAP